MFMTADNLNSARFDSISFCEQLTLNDWPQGQHVTTSGHLELHALITCNSGQHFAGSSELLPV